MQQLISIKSIPIKLDYNVTHASVEIKQPLPTAKVTREPGSYEMSSEPIQVLLDTYQCRKSYGYKNQTDLSKDYAARGKKAVEEATIATVKEGNAMEQGFVDGNPNIIPQLAAQKYNIKNIDTILAFIPNARPEISWKGGTLDIHYNKEQMNCDWDIKKPEVNYTPGNIDISVLQYPKVIIEYLGGPIYVPPSADPNYKPVDAKA